MMRKKRSKKSKNYKVIVMNDDHNTFEFVTNVLQEICGHNYLQAVQCTNLIHSRGFCEVFIDHPTICTQIYDALIQEGLTATLVK